MATIGEWLEFLDRLYPPAWAEQWDNVGLQVGDRGADVQRVAVALDPTVEVIRDSGERGASLLITHHPLLHRPLTQVDTAEPQAAAVAEALRRGVGVVACHTNADVASPGVSDALAAALDIPVGGPLVPAGAGERVKLVTFVPVDDTHAVIEKLARAGAGVIGEYEVCSFRVGGTGTFRPTKDARPKKGKKLVVNEVAEDRLEMVVRTERLEEVVAALIEVHPYDEVAYDVYALAGATGLGLGRIGELPESTTASTLATACSDALGSDARLAGEPDSEVSSVAVCGGSGGSLIPAAVAAGVDAFVTGDVKHHEALEARAAGMAIIDAGHHGTEWPFVEHLAERLREEGPKADVEVAEVPTDPFAT